MQIDFKHTEPGTTRWEPGEILTVRIVAADADQYLAETVETWPPDLKDRHAIEVAALREQLAEAHRRHGEYQEEIGALNAEIAAGRRLGSSAPA